MTFDPPAPGQWELETAHHGLRPLSPFLRDTYSERSKQASSSSMQRYGLPLAHRAGQVRPRLPVHAPAGRRREARLHAQGPAAGVRDEADRPPAPRAAPARQDCRAGVRGTALAPGSRPVVRPRPVGAAGEEPCAAGRRARRPRRCRARGTHRERARALRDNRRAGTWRHTAAIWCRPAICWLTASGGESAPTRPPDCSPAAHRQRSRRP